MRKLIYILPLLTLFTFSICGNAHAQKGKKKEKDKTEKTGSSEKEKKKDWDELIKKCTLSDGLIPLYRDTVSGEMYMALAPEQLDKEYIYFSFVSNGVVEAGFFRGNYRGSKIIRFRKNYNRLEVLEENTKYYFDPASPLSRAANANINTPVLASLEVKATHEDTKAIMVSADALYKSEDFEMIKQPERDGEKSMLGKLNKEKTTINAVRNYPENTDVEVTYVFDNESPKKSGSPAATDVRNLGISYQHSIIEVPQNNFKPRRDDARVGYFMSWQNEMTSLEVAPYRDMIHRWHLEKKSPNLAISEPVEPITFWIENTTPLEFRATIKESGERWNKAFEKAGFKNALVIKEQPDTASWDAGDIRYNVLRWTSSPQPPFGGYGPSFVNPRTGQILGADIMLEFSAVAKRLFKKEVFETAGYSTFEDEADANRIDGLHACAMGEVMHHNTVFGLTALKVENLGEAAEEQFVKETLARLILHEIGHTLGLTHNMRASTLLSLEEINTPAVVLDKGLCSSVMEYPAINYAPSEQEATRYYDDNPGAYDLWVIEYGYSEANPDSTQEEDRLDKILSRSTEHQLAYGNDGDDMRSPGQGIDPDINIYDLSNDPVGYGIQRVQRINVLMDSLLSKYSIDGESYEAFRQAYLVLTGEYAIQLGIFTRQIGGVHINRAAVGQAGNTSAPFVPVSADDQKAAMAALTKYAFAPDAFYSSTEVYTHLQPQRRGFSQRGSGEDPKIHARYLAMQKNCLRHLLHPNVLERITDSELYGNDFKLSQYMTLLTDGIFKADLAGNVNAMRQNVQVEYTRQLALALAGAKLDHVANSMVLYELNRIDGMAQGYANAGDLATKAHRAHLRQLIKKALEA